MILKFKTNARTARNIMFERITSKILTLQTSFSFLENEDMRPLLQSKYLHIILKNETDLWNSKEINSAQYWITLENKLKINDLTLTFLD